MRFQISRGILMSSALVRDVQEFWCCQISRRTAAMASLK